MATLKEINEPNDWQTLIYYRCWNASKIENTTPTSTEETPKKSNKILNFFYKEKTPTHVEVDEEGNETIVEDEPVKNLDWFKIGATSTGLAAFIGLLIWLIKKHH